MFLAALLNVLRFQSMLFPLDYFDVTERHVCLFFFSVLPPAPITRYLCFFR
jgi:hypothetical protein